MSHVDLFSPLKLGNYELRNRVFMAPMTRCRADAGRVPNDLMAQYYSQRASAGLIITECTQISPTAVSFPNTPGIHSPEQVAGWKRATQAVHDKGGRIFLQVWHTGRASHPDAIPGGLQPVAPSAIPAKGTIYTPNGMQTYATPRALTIDEIQEIVSQFSQAAKNAVQAGFDGVELHGANGYLVDEFIRDGSNQRTDRYGGSIENRARFPVEVTQALIRAVGPERVGVRLSPSGTYNDMHDSNARATFGHVVRELDKLNPAYLHITEANQKDVGHGGDDIPVSYFRPLFKNVLVTNGGFTREKGDHYIAAGHANAIAFGTSFLANPDLPARLKTGAAQNIPDPNTFYASGPLGYIDYPALA